MSVLAVRAPMVPKSSEKLGKTPETKNPGVANGPNPYGDLLIARMRETADLSQEAAMPRGADRKQAVYEDLLATAKKSQASALAKLEELKSQGLVTQFESMYMPNAIVVKVASGKASAVSSALKSLADIQDVSENRTWQIPTPIVNSIEGAANIAPKGSTEWGVEKIGAPNAWSKGFNGEGVTIGIVDTGLDSSHPAISGHYRGTQADGSQTHDYNWFDPAQGKLKPYDDGDHGTHVAGTSGGGTADRKIGVAPGAKIIAAKAILGNGLNTTVATLQALQFMLAPTDVNGKNPNPRLGADVVNNSWGNADQNDTTFVETWNDLIAAGIEPIAAAGNDGPSKGTVSPPGSYPMGISVAATGSSDKVAGFSSRGPSKFDPKATVPLIAAPGAGVTSSIPGGRYANFSGTSMASPHVAGAVALLLQAKPTATHDELVKALTSTATDVSSAGVDLDSGYGRINVDKAIDYLLNPPAIAKSA